MKKPTKSLIKTDFPKGGRRKMGQTTMLRSLQVGSSIKVHPLKVSAPKNLHTIANRLGMKVAVRKITDGRNAGKLEVFRLK